MVDYGGAFKKPFQDITKLIIGIVLSIIPIVNFLAMGYTVETAKKTLAKDNNLPEWTNWGGLFVQGIMIVIIALIYMIPAIVIALVGLAPLVGAVAGAATSGGDPTAAIASALAGAGIMLILAGIIFLITIFLLPMAMIHFARDGFGGAFKFGSIIKACLTGSYIITWIIVMVVTGILSGVLMIIPLVGPAIASFYMGIVSYTMFAQVLTEQTGN